MARNNEVEIKDSIEHTPGFDVSLISDGEFIFEEYRYFIVLTSDIKKFEKIIDERRATNSIYNSLSSLEINDPNKDLELPCTDKECFRESE